MQFKSALKEESSKEEQKDYMRNAGSIVSRILCGVKNAMSNLQHAPFIGPKSLNGGEVIISEGTRISIAAPFSNSLASYAYHI